MSADRSSWMQKGVFPNARAPARIPVKHSPQNGGDVRIQFVSGNVQCRGSVTNLEPGKKKLK